MLLDVQTLLTICFTKQTKTELLPFIVFQRIQFAFYTSLSSHVFILQDYSCWQKLWSHWWLGYVLCSAEGMLVVIIYCVVFFKCLCSKFFLCIWEKVSLFSEFSMHLNVVMFFTVIFFSNNIIFLPGELSSMVPSQVCKLILLGILNLYPFA